MIYNIGDKVKSWLPEDQIEPEALKQVLNTASMPFVTPYMAVMPDCHFGMGATVGSCIPTQGAVMPAAVGVDIGCGMMAVLTQWKRDQLPEDLAPIRVGIESVVPLSAGRYNSKLTVSAENRIGRLEEEYAGAYQIDFIDGVCKNWRNQLGSLGSGNHFIEITVDEQDRVWAFLHSGSRGVGLRVATCYIKRAQELMDKYFIQLPDKDLAYLPEHTSEYYLYMRDLEWCQQFAFLNREEMMDRVLQVLSSAMDETAERLLEVNCHHNYSAMENHQGKNLLVSRKGCIRAREGDFGLIPGSMGERSYVVRGKGNVASFCTAPHGAGRKMSRRAARRTFTMDDFRERMEGVEVRMTEDFIDEIPGAYKDIDLVMEQSSDLVEIVHTLKQIVNVKGA